MSTSTFIEQLAAGQAADAKETLSNLLSARAFEALDARKQELGATLFGNQVEEEVEGVEESMDQPMSKNLAKGYTSNQEHGDKAPKMSDKQKAAAKAARDARDAADMKKYFAKSDAEMREEVEELDEISLKTATSAYVKRMGPGSDEKDPYGHKAIKTMDHIANRYGKKGVAKTAKAADDEYGIHDPEHNPRKDYVKMIMRGAKPFRK